MPTEEGYFSRHLILSYFGTWMCSNVETIHPWTCLVSELLSFEHPSVILCYFITSTVNEVGAYIGITLSVRLSFQIKLNLGFNFWTKRDGAFILNTWIPCFKIFLSVPQILTFWPWPWFLTYFSQKLNLSYNFWTKRDKAFILQLWLPCGKTFLFLIKSFDPVTLTLTFDLLEKLNLGHNFRIKGDKPFILYWWVPCDKTFLSVPKILTLWPWPCILTYFSKNWTLAITFEPKKK